MAKRTIGVDVGGTKISTGLVADGALVDYRERRLGARDYGALIAMITAVAQSVRDEAPQDELSLGVAVAAWLSPDRETVANAVNLGWAGRSLRQDLELATGVPTVVTNDGDAAAWGEFIFARSQHPDQSTGAMVMLTLGTDVGGGVVINGQLVAGPTGAAGEIGHMLVDPQGPPCVCGAQGCLAVYASGTAMLRQARLRVSGAGTGPEKPSAGTTLLNQFCGGDPERLTGDHLAEAARRCDPAALGVVEAAARAIAFTSSQVSRVIDHSSLVLGGGASRIGDPLLSATRAALRQTASIGPLRPLPAVSVAQLGNQAGVIGAADLAARFTRAHQSA